MVFCVKREEANPMARKRKTRKIHRSAVTGRFVTQEYAKRHPKTTVTETSKAPPRRKK